MVGDPAPGKAELDRAGWLVNAHVNAAAAIAGSKINPVVTNATIGVAAGYKIARGTHTPTTGSDTVVTGLSTVVAAVASLKGAPTLTHMLVAADIGNQAGAPAAGSIYIKSYKPTTSTDVTPIAATTPWGAVDWIAIGT